MIWVEVGSGPVGVASTEDGQVWVVGADDSTLAHIDTKGSRLTAQVTAGLPFAAASFEHIISRHPIEPWWADIARVLQPGGTYWVDYTLRLKNVQQHSDKMWPDFPTFDLNNTTIDLNGATLYSTLEPCPMCLWLILEAKIGRVVLGARHAALKRTDTGDYSVETFLALTKRKLDVVTGVLEQQCVDLRLQWMRDQQAKAQSA